MAQPRQHRTSETALAAGVAIPAHPLAVDTNRRLDERRQRALSRYYLDAGAGGLAVGVHTTQFQIHEASCGLYHAVLALAKEEMDKAESAGHRRLVRVAGICGRTDQAIREATLSRELGYEYGLLNLSAMEGDSLDQLIEHCRAVAEVIGLFGFYLQPAVGGIELPYEFWTKFCEIENVVAIKVAAFDRYRTTDVVRAVAESGRSDIALYTGNDDAIVADLITPYEFPSRDRPVRRTFVGGLLGQWAVWTQRAVELCERCRVARNSHDGLDPQLLPLGIQLTDANAAIFDARNGFRGCIPGIHEVLRRQGLLAGVWCLDESEVLSRGQMQEIDRVLAAYPQLNDNEFVAEHRDRWLSG